jgi:hypothetical protein
MENATDIVGAGAVLSEKLTEALSKNGSYQVVQRMKTPGDDETLVLQERSLGQVDAVLVGSFTDYNLDSDVVYRTDPTKTECTEGFLGGMNCSTSGGGSRPVSIKHTMTAEARLRLIDVRDGRVLHTITVSGTGVLNTKIGPFSSVASTMKKFKFDKSNPILSKIMKDISRQLLTEISFTSAKITEAELSLKTATGDTHEPAKVFSVGDDKMAVVVELPSVAENNTFRLDIIRDDQSLAVKEFIWLANDYSSNIYYFSIGEIATKGGGPGNYKVRLYNGETLMQTSNFQLK